MTMFSGTNTFLRDGGTLQPKEVERVKKHLDDASSLFNYDTQLMIAANEVSQRVGIRKTSR
jgi:hypothetical protein